MSLLTSHLSHYLDVEFGVVATELRLEGVKALLIVLALLQFFGDRLLSLFEFVQIHCFALQHDCVLLLIDTEVQRLQKWDCFLILPQVEVQLLVVEFQRPELFLLRIANYVTQYFLQESQRDQLFLVGDVVLQQQREGVLHFAWLGLLFRLALLRLLFLGYQRRRLLHFRGQKLGDFHFHELFDSESLQGFLRVAPVSLKNVDERLHLLRLSPQVDGDLSEQFACVRHY